VFFLGALPFVACSDEGSNVLDKGVADVRNDNSYMWLDAPSQGKDVLLVDTVTKADRPVCSPRKSGQAQDKVEKYVPASNEVAAWVEDTNLGPAGVEAGYTYDDIVAIIDGSQEPYADAGCVGFAKQDYKKDTFTLGLMIWEMKDNAAAKKMFDKDKGDLSSEGFINTEDIACIYDGSVIGNDRQMWKGYVYKSQYLFKFVGICSKSSEAPALKDQMLPFINALADKLP
jgi:hypothetical protein